MPKVLLALTSHDQLGDTGRTTGFYVPEAAHPHRVFTEAGYEVDFVSVAGAEPPRDGLRPDDPELARFLADHSQRLANTPTPDQLDPADYDAIFFVGGHGTMWDFPESALADFAAGVYERGGVVAGVCHGPAGLVNVRLSDGRYLVDGKLISAFTNEEEEAVGLTEVVPFLLESKLVERGAQFTKTANFATHAVADDRVVTGQNPASASRVAQLVVEELAAARPAATRLSAAQRSAVYLLDESVSFLYAGALRAVAVLGVADHLVDGPRTAAELAGPTGADADFLARTLRVLCARRLFHQDADGRFSLSPLGDALRTDAEVSVRAVITDMTTTTTHWRSGGELARAVQDGRPVFETLYGLPYYEHVRTDEVGASFNHAMALFSAAVDTVAVQQCEFPPGATVVDVGGGAGGLLVQALADRPDLRGILVDQEHVLAGHRLGELGDPGRWETVPGDFFASVPTGGDVYVLKRILHNWSDEECVQILQNCRKAMSDGGRLVVIDPIIPPGNGPDAAKLHDLIMMMLLTGRERTEAELVHLLDQAGLRLTRVVYTGAPAAFIEAEPV